MQDSKSVIGQGSSATGEAAAISRSVTGQVSVPYILGGNEVTAVGPYAFSSCQVSAVQLPDSIKEICTNAFCSCDNLAEMHVHEHLTAIAYGAFCYNSCLTAFTVEEGNSAYKSINGMLLSADGKTLIAGSNYAGYNVPEGVETIASQAF